MSTFWTILLVLIVLAIIVIVILAKLYRKASREVSFIRTGIGGQQVVMAGGAIALPYFHEVSEVNMRTLRLEVTRRGEDSLITKDRLRVDVGASFSVAVESTEQAVERAAQTLGDRTFSADKLREIVEGKLVDALRAVAARMTLDELHEGRAQFVSDVRDLIKDDLAENGLRIQSVSLTSLDQTPFKDLDENNAFNAVGMRRLAEVIANSKKERAEIDADADVSVALSSMEATRRKLEIEQDEEQARIEQQQRIETLRAAQTAEIARRKADSEREAEAARIAKEHAVREAEIVRDKQIRFTEIAKELDLQASEIAKERDLQIQQQERMIAIAQKSAQEAQAQGVADQAKADAVQVAEAVITVRQLAEAEREKQLAILASQQGAEADATRLTTLARAEQEAAEGHANALMHTAKAEAQATREKAEASKISLLAEAEGQRALAEAENSLNDRIIFMKEELARLETLPKALAEMVKPAERIDSIKIHHVTGLGGAQGGTGDTPPLTKTPINQALDSILDMTVQMPALKKLGDELGISMGDGLLQAKREQDTTADDTSTDDKA